MLAAEEARLPVAVRERIYTDPFARGGMNELPLAEIDAAVGCAFFVSLKKDEITGDQFLCALCPEAELILLVRGDRKSTRLNSSHW